MPRLLPALFLLVTLSACQPPADDTGPEMPPERQDGTSAQAGWTLPWQYVGVPVCLLNGNAAPAGGSGGLVDALLDTSVTDAQLLQVLAPTQVDDPDGGLLAFIRENWGGALRDGYSLDAWPAELELQIRETTDARLDPAALVLPWPFPSDTIGALQKRLEDAREAAGLPPIPSLGTPSASSVLLEPIMSLGEKTLFDSTTRDAFEREAKGQGCNVERDWLANQLGTTYPRNFTACVDDSRLTTQTQWEWSGANTDSLHFRLGWKQEKMLGLYYHKWPCGAFSGYD